MIIESSIQVRLGARVKVLQLVYADSKLIREEVVYGWVIRPARKEEYMQETHAQVWEDKYFYYEIRLEESHDQKRDTEYNK